MSVAAPIAMALSAVGSIVGGVEDDHAAHVAAGIDEQDARLTLLEGEQQGLQTRKDERMQAGDVLAAMGGSGVAIGEGTTGDLIAQSAYQRELEILNIRTRAAQGANNLYQSAADKRAAGRAALVSSVFGAVSTALKGASDIRAQRMLTAQRTTETAAMLGGGTRARTVGTPGISPVAAPPRMTVKGTL